MSATVSRIAQRWFVSFTVEVGRRMPAAHVRPGSDIDIDLGVKTLLTGVDGAGRIVRIPARSRCGHRCANCDARAGPWRLRD